MRIWPLLSFDIRRNEVCTALIGGTARMGRTKARRRGAERDGWAGEKVIFAQILGILGFGGEIRRRSGLRRDKIGFDWPFDFAQGRAELEFWAGIGFELALF